MNRSMRFAGIVLVLILAVTVSAFAQGLYWESTMSGGPLGDKSMTSKTYYMPKRFKVEGAGMGQEDMIFLLDKQIIYTIQPKDKTYSEMTFAEFEAAMKKLSSKSNAKMAELQEKMKNMPEAQRKMMEDMINKMPGQGKEAKIDVKETGDKKTITGYSCEKFAVTQDDKDFLSLWVTKDISTDAMTADMKEFSQRMLSMNPAGMKGLADAMAKIKGFPMETDMAQGITQVVTKVEKRSTPDSEFQVPAGYTKVPSKLAGADTKD